MIAENMLTRTYADGNVAMAIETMLNNRKDDAAYDLKHKHVRFNDQKKVRKSTQEWDLQVLWQDRTTDWLSLEDLKIKFFESI